MQESREFEIADLKQYLLGNLTPAESETIDLQIISDESLEDELHWAESELMEDYLDETLSPPEVESFRTNFLISSERKAQLRQISLMRNYARNAATKGVSEKVCGEEPENFFEKLKNFFSHNLRPAIAVLALIIVSLFAGTIIYYTTNEQTALEKEFAEINKKDLSDPAEFKNLLTVNLMTGAFRDSSGLSKLSEDKLGERVLFRLALPFEVNTVDNFKSELVRDQKIVFTQNKLRVYNNPNGQELRLFLPALVLKKGEYQIRVAKGTAKESVFNYNFAVQ
jgi:hypothetical protein